MLILPHPSFALSLLLSVRPRHQPQIRLVYQRRRLERLPRLLLRELLPREPAQLVIDQRQQLLGGLRIALLNGRQD
jgi:hypothetical protein